MHNDLQVDQPALIINVEQEKNTHVIGTCVNVIDLMSVEESVYYFRESEDKLVTEPYALIEINGIVGGIRQRYLMPIPPLDDQTEIESKLILTPWELAQ